MRHAITCALPLRVRERVLVVARGEVGGDGAEPLHHLLALVGVEEDVPEVRALDLAAVVEPARDLERPVEVPEPALGVHDGEQARRRVDDRLEEAVLGADLGLEPFLLERERRRRGDGLDELGLIAEAPVVDQSGDPLAVLIDERGRLRCPAQSVRAAFGLRRRPMPGGRSTSRRVERGIAERVRQSVSERRAVADRDGEIGDARACEPRPEDAGEERDRHQREEQSATSSSHDRGRCAEGPTSCSRGAPRAPRA